MLSEALARERWTLREAQKLTRKEDWRRLMMEREVNRMDPDFRFASEEDTMKQPRSPLSHLERIQTEQ